MLLRQTRFPGGLESLEPKSPRDRQGHWSPTKTVHWRPTNILEIRVFVALHWLLANVLPAFRVFSGPAHATHTTLRNLTWFNPTSHNLTQLNTICGSVPTSFSLVQCSRTQTCQKSKGWNRPKKVRWERTNFGWFERKYKAGSSKSSCSTTTDCHWLSSQQQLKTLRRRNVNNVRKGFSQCSHRRRHTVYSHGLPMSSRTSSCWSLSVWLSPMQQLQLCVEPTFTLGFRIPLSQHLFPKAATKAEIPRQNISKNQI